MKKLTISLLAGLFITSNAFALTIIPPIPGSPRVETLDLNSKNWSGFGKNTIHDQAPNFLSNDYYEIKFNTPVTCNSRLC